MQGISFHRPPRAYTERLPTDPITIAAPPNMPTAQQGAAAYIQYLLPLVGALASVGYMFSFHGSTSPFMFVGMGGMMVASVGGGFLTGWFQRRNTKKQRAATREKYLRYLEQQRTRLADITRRQQDVGQRLHPAPSVLAARAESREGLWERRSYDEDFLTLRTGRGAAPLCAPVHVDGGQNPLADFDEELMAKARGVAGQFAQVGDAPVTIALRDLQLVTVTGEPNAASGLVRSLLCQLALFHAPNDARIIAYFPRERASQWSWLKWAPHTRRLRTVKASKGAVGDPLCMLADTPETFAAMLETQALPEIERRRKLTAARTGANEKKTPSLPHFIIVIDGYSPRGPLARILALDALIQDAGQVGVTVVTLVTTRDDEPTSAQARIDLTTGEWASYQGMAFGGQRVEGFTADQLSVTEADRVARTLTPLTLGNDGGQRDLSDDIRLLELLGIGSADALSPATAWHPRDRESLLRAPIGLTVSGEPLIIDLKEAAEGGMGPHGLIIGATGSGKSELLRTLVTSLAVTHDPELVNFVLADFKGGASFADLARLPHTVGMITNIESDLTLVDRMRDALFGEQERRQRMLREAGNLDNIQQYRTRRQSNPTLEPMPHLLIIVDEFAELLSNRPDFMELFIAIGRLGRSLGMHLLLATQRLGEGRIQGLEGHLRYRICLRTFSAAESSTVINTPDAFYLPSYPGVGYFKVDTTMYIQFKTATVSSPYQSAAAETSASQPHVRLFTATGALVEAPSAGGYGAHRGAPIAVVEEASHPVDSLHTDMDAIIGRLEGGRPGSAATHQVWLPPLPHQLPLGALLPPSMRSLTEAWAATPFGTLTVPLALMDVPREQAQRPMTLNFLGLGGHLAVVGAPQSGKSVLLQSLCAAVVLTHSPRDVQIYGIDFGGGLLRGLEDLPHVGAICGKQEREMVRRLLRQIRGVIEERELLFRRLRIDTMETFRRRRQAGELDDQPFGDVFLVIDDLGQLLTDFDQVTDEIMDIVATGLTYGVHVILTAKRWADIRAKMRDNIGSRLELRLNDPSESEMGRGAATALSHTAPGRGIIKGGTQFQTALPSLRTREQGQDTMPDYSAGDDLAHLIAQARAAWRGPSAPPVLMLPALVTEEQLQTAQASADAAENTGVAIGLEEFRLEPQYIDLLSGGPHFLVFGDSECGKTTLLRTWMRGLERTYSPEQTQFALVDNRRALLDFLDSPSLFGYACTAPMLKELVDKLKRELEGRVLSSAHLTIEQLRNPKRWEGPHFILFVDDYDSVLGPAGNPLAPLVDLIQQGRDIGFHVVLTRRVLGTSRGAFEAVFQRIKETGSPGLIMSGDPQEGALLGNQRAGALPPGRGYLVRRGQRVTLVQTVYSPPPER